MRDNNHSPDCAWTKAECEYKETHFYCPHPEHACTCHVFNAAKEDDQPLRCEIVGNRLVVSIGMSTLAFAAGQVHEIKVTNAEGFAKDVLSELNREAEDGTTIVHEMIDKATLRAFEEGSEHANYDKQ